MIVFEIHDTGERTVAEDIKEVQEAYEKIKEYRRDVFKQAISEHRTYRWIAAAAGMTASSVYQLINGAYPKK